MARMGDALLEARFGTVLLFGIAMRGRKRFEEHSKYQLNHRAVSLLYLSFIIHFPLLHWQIFFAFPASFAIIDQEPALARFMSAMQKPIGPFGPATTYELARVSLMRWSERS